MSHDVICGDALAVLSGMESESVHLCLTSPPYWNLRDYGVTGQLGLERDPWEYIGTMVGVFQQVRRVLRKDGTLWLNIGASYSGYHGNKNSEIPTSSTNGWTNGYNENLRASLTGGFKAKDLVPIPWMLGMALQADGWYLRADCIWSKPNPMPSSVLDRPTAAHEYVLILSKSARYFYDAEAIREPATHPTTKMPDNWDTGEGGHGSFHRDGREKGRRTDKQRGHGRVHAGFNDRWDGMTKAEQAAMGRNKRDVFTIATEPFPDAHFATFPQRLAEIPILAGTSQRGVCDSCAAPWCRIIAVDYANPGNRTTNGPRSIENRDSAPGFGQRLERETHTLGWKPSCACDAGEPLPAVVLDPFAGSGTTASVAKRLGRSSISVELNPAYVELIHNRINGTQPPLPMWEETELPA